MDIGNNILFTKTGVGLDVLLAGHSLMKPVLGQESRKMAVLP